MIRRWSCGGVVASALLTLAALGCGETPPPTVVSERYSPESLAGELVLRSKSLGPGRRDVAKSQPAAGKASSKRAREQTKAAEAVTLDDLVRETVEKAASIPGLSKPEAVNKIAEAVAKDDSIPEADRKAIADRLRAGGG